MMESCNCVEPQWPPDDLFMRYQYISDFFIALAYFSIPLELIYFVKNSAIFPYRWVLVQFGAFIVLCGATHLISLWTFTPHSWTVTLVMTVAKVLTAVVSCATALMLVHIIPDLLSVKTRELFLKNKAAELDREMGLIRTQEETGRHVRMLTQEIRSTLDRQMILNTTLVELGKTLALEECALWMPTRSGVELQLSYTLRLHKPVPMTVPIYHPTIRQVFSSHRAMVISPNSPVAVTRPIAGKYMAGDVVAMRVPLLHLNNFEIADWPDLSKRPYALMVLMLPSDSARRWHVHELELVEVVAEQVAVALSHAAILEESMRARDLLMEQNVALDMARQEAETAIRARNDFLAVMNHEMRTPINAIIAFTSLLKETDLTPEQRSMVETVLKSSNLLATLMNDVLDMSRLEDGSLKLDLRTFNLPAAFREVLNLVKPIAAVKKLLVTLQLDPDLPEFAVGDDKRLMQTTLNVVGNAVKFTKEGSVVITVCLERQEYLKDPRFPDFHPVHNEGYFFLRVQVQDTGFGVNPVDIPKLFNKFVQVDSAITRSPGGTGLGLAICKRFVMLMEGHIWIESAGLGKGCTVTFIIKLQLPEHWSDTRQLALTTTSSNVWGDFTGTQPILFEDTAQGNEKVTSKSEIKVLAIIENLADRAVVKGVLNRLGCEVTFTNAGCEALQTIARAVQSFKVILIDMSTPGMDGLEVGIHILERYPTTGSGRPLLIALTANSDRLTRDRCLGSGMDCVVVKPVSLENMKSVLSELLGGV